MTWALAAFDAMAAIAGFAFLIHAARSWNTKTRELKERYPRLR